ncbi:DUF3386 domain-containing protein [Prochlorococcus sp. MIT 1341]|uniref:DUF3386 domain-containing protein n=1 Tax=Prochlorococcus sp. MIT 1341 TaxID=3096221 RepID=UPI002A7594BE|nr:DUF3386 domain-containing protein [Prochlorococcus sp. MIT 1341]
MASTLPKTDLIPGSDCRDRFRAAYDNRYTWDYGFSGYEGRCSFCKEDISVEGNFVVDADLKIHVHGISDDNLSKAITSQLWEVTIHRVRRSFDDTHGQNNFTLGNINNVGEEVIVTGKNKGDRYRIKDDIVTMVHRNIHGKLIKIYTKSIINTGKGYLSKTYNSQYFDPSSGNPISGISHFSDSFVNLENTGFWILEKRIIDVDSHQNSSPSTKAFRFWEMKLYS